jgi:transposase
MNTPSTPKRSLNLSRDQQIQACTLHDAGLTYAIIPQRLGCTQRQVQHACQAPQFTPKKRSGRSMKLSQSQQEEIIEFITFTKDGRRYSYLQTAKLHFQSMRCWEIRNQIRPAQSWLQTICGSYKTIAVGGK